jgi:hypothetical protein
VLLAVRDRFEQYASAMAATVACCSPQPARPETASGRHSRGICDGPDQHDRDMNRRAAAEVTILSIMALGAMGLGFRRQ